MVSVAVADEVRAGNDNSVTSMPTSGGTGLAGRIADLDIHFGLSGVAEHLADTFMVLARPIIGRSPNRSSISFI